MVSGVLLLIVGGVVDHMKLFVPLVLSLRKSCVLYVIHVVASWGPKNLGAGASPFCWACMIDPQNLPLR